MKQRSLVTMLLFITPLLCAVCLYANSVRLPFFSDDIPTQRYLSHATLSDIFTKVDMNGTYYRPFANIFYKFVPLNAPLWHSIMVWLHLMNTVLVGVLARQVRLTRFGQWLAMTLFAVFPFTAQAVLWIGAGFHLLLTCLVLVATIASIATVQRHSQAPTPFTAGRLGRYLLAISAGMLAPFAHESGILTPIVMLLLMVGAVGLREAWHRWRVIVALLVPMAIASGAYWVIRGQVLKSGVGLVFDPQRIGANGAFFAQGLSLPFQFIAGLLEGDALTRSIVATLAFLVLVLALLARQRTSWRLASLLVLSSAVALAPAYLVLHPDYVRYGERLMGVAVPAMVILYALVTQAMPRWVRVLWVTPFIVACVLFSQEYIYLHQLQGVTYNRLFVDLAHEETGDPRMLFINLPSQIESVRDPLPLTRANAGLLTDWLELRDFLWLNMDGREFTHISYPYIPELYPELDGYRQRVYGILASFGEVTTLIAQNDDVLRTHFIHQQYVVDWIGRRTPALADPSIVFSDGMALQEVAFAYTDDGRLRVRLAWQKQDDTITPDTPFVHLLCNGEMVTQADGDPLDNLYPFSGWQAGDTWADYRYFDVSSVDDACLSVRVGLYNRVDNTRATVTQMGTPLSDPWVIVTVDGR